MKKLEQIAGCINQLGEFCGKRDLPCLSQEALKSGYGFDKVDVMVLFGGSILCGGDVLAQAMQVGLANVYVIVGGAGHTTETLREKVQQQYPAIQTAGRPEAEIFSAYLQHRYGLKPDLLERDSTNCGNNITYLLRLLKEKQISFHSILLAQDATMQRRMEAGLQKYLENDVQAINYATYRARVVVKHDRLAYQDAILGMWDLQRYITLLMGEIPRLEDSPTGYGPNGKNFIAHVDIPRPVQAAFEELQQYYRGRIREADPRYASVEISGGF